MLIFNKIMRGSKPLRSDSPRFYFLYTKNMVREGVTWGSHGSAFKYDMLSCIFRMREILPHKIALLHMWDTPSVEEARGLFLRTRDAVYISTSIDTDGRTSSCRSLISRTYIPAGETQDFSVSVFLTLYIARF